MRKYYPLSKSEQGIYISSLNGGDAYNLANTVNLGKEVTPEQVEKALQDVLAAHPYLFTILSNDEEGNLVKHIEVEEIHLPLEECKELDVESFPYEMLDRHLYRFKLYRYKGDLIFYFDFHHILMDGTSIKIFIDDFFSALEGKRLEKEVSTANDYKNLKEGGFGISLVKSLTEEVNYSYQDGHSIVSMSFAIGQ